MLQNTNIAWGAQNVAKNEIGAFTGEVSAEMLRDFGATYVIIGHSERATAYCESDENIATKFVQAKKHGLTPILCVGETLIEREAGVMEMVVGKQLDTIIQLYGAQVFADSVISYEPIWAIGTGLAATPEQAKAMHLFIRNKIANLNLEAANHLKILYGGSVNPQNAVQLFLVENIDGGLIGKCSLNAEEFEVICHAAEKSAN
jgi:triosephosphate isomerase